MAMQKLNVRFSDELKIKLQEDANKYNCNESDLARAAIVAGLEWLEQKNEVVNPERLIEIIKSNQALTQY